MGRAGREGGPRPAIAAQATRRPEVSEADVAALVQQQVLRLHVPKENKKMLNH